MAKPLVVVLPHDLGKAEAERRLRAGLQHVGSSFGGALGAVQHTWSGDHVDFGVTLLGTATRGGIDVAEDHITLTVELPWFLARLAEKAKSLIAREGRLLLDKK